MKTECSFTELFGSRKQPERLGFNAKQVLARKLWLYGVPNPGWFVKELGVRLLLCASQKMRGSVQLTLDFDGKED